MSGGGIKAVKARREEQRSVPASTSAQPVSVVHHSAPTTVIVGGGYGYGPSCGKKNTF